MTSEVWSITTDKHSLESVNDSVSSEITDLVDKVEFVMTLGAASRPVFRKLFGVDHKRRRCLCPC